MAHSQTCEALVIKTYDVGEADRFCILFTKEKGRIAARATGARRLTSKLGAAVLPFNHIRVELKENAAGWMVTGVSRLTDDASKSLQEFTALEQGAELLLRLVTDEGALPEIFAVTEKFFRAPHVLGYTFSLLHYSGFLPADSELPQNLSVAEYGFINAARSGNLTVPDAACNKRKLQDLASQLLEEHLRSPLKASVAQEW